MKKINKILEIIKLIKIRHILILIILLIFNTYAWFIYTMKVSTRLEARVSSWDVDIQNSSGESLDSTIVVDRMYPGMETFEKEIVVHNYGEIEAVLSYEIQSYELLGQNFEVSNGDIIITSEDLKNKLLTEYPFKVQVSISDEIIAAYDGEGTFKITVDWPYESENDEADTFWGESAASFYKNNPSAPCLNMQMILYVKQKQT